MVAVAYGLTQLLSLRLGRFLTWDEAVYISEVSPFAEAVGMGAHRARGITLLVAPITVATESMMALRVFLVFVSSGAVFGSFVVWVRSIRWAAPIAAALFASSWLSVFYGSAVLPNLYSALLAVAAVGLTVRIARSPSVSQLLLLAGLTALAALVRPLDALILLFCVVLVGLAMAPSHLPGLAGAAMAGLGVGALPWAVESWVRFGGPLERLSTARELVGGGIHNNVIEYLRLMDGTSGPVNRAAAMWLAVLVLLGVAGIVLHNRDARLASAIAFVSAVLFVSPYLFATEPLAQRFMLPGLALLCISSGLGLTALTPRLGTPGWGIVVIMALVVLMTSWNLPALQAWDERQAGNGATALILGNEISGEVGGSGCSFLSPANHPAISVASGCRGGQIRDSAAANIRWADDARREGSDVFVVTNSNDPGTIVGDGWLCEPVGPLAHRGWRLCKPSDQ
jgi:hypothetical protein